MFEGERSRQSPHVPESPRIELPTLRDSFVRNANMYRLPGDPPFRESARKNGKEISGDLDRYLKTRDIPSSPEDIERYQALEQSSENIRLVLLGVEALIETDHIASVTETQSGIQKISHLVDLGISLGSEVLLSASLLLGAKERAEAFRRVLANYTLRLFPFVAKNLITCNPEDADSITDSLNNLIQRQISARTLTLTEGEMLLPLCPLLEPSVEEALLQELHDIVVFELQRGRLNHSRRELIHYFPEPYRGQLLELLASAPAAQPDASKQRRGAAFHERHRLYRDMPAHFRSAPFSKDGSTLTVLGENFENRVIVRDIDTLAFLGWRKAFEASETWESLGFSYVPVEPIVRALPEKNIDTMHVRARVLRGITIRDWLNLHDTLFEKELRAQQAKIREGLRTIGVEFAQENKAHDHDNNYIVVPERDEHDQPRFDVPPRLYVIDFDQAAPYICNPSPTR